MRSRSETGVAIAVSVVIDAPPAAVWAELARIEDHVIWMRERDRDTAFGETSGAGSGRPSNARRAWARFA